MKTYKTFFLTASLLVALLLLSACKTRPNYSIQDGRQFLETQGYETEIVDAITTLQEVEPELFDTLLASESADVRYLLAANQFISSKQLERLTVDSDETIRAKAATHSKITWEQASRLFKEDSRIISQSLARNAVVPEDILLLLYEDQNPGLVFFAYNPNCPKLIRQRIKASRDTQAKRWLETMEAS